MTTRQADKAEQDALKLLKESPSVMVDLSLVPSSRYNRDCGHRLYVAGIPPENIFPKGRRQFVGFHQWMCVTLRHPSYCKGLLDMAADLPSVKPFGTVTWIGDIRVVKLSKRRKGIMLFIPLRLWNPFPRQRIHTKGILHPVVSGRGRFIYHILEIPAIQKETVVTKYLSPVGEGENPNGNSG